MNYDPHSIPLKVLNIALLEKGSTIVICLHFGNLVSSIYQVLLVMPFDVFVC